MRFLTILISVIAGIVLGIVLVNNPHDVMLDLNPFLKSRDPFVTLYRIFPLWLVMLVCAAVGFFFGWLLGVTSGYSDKPPAAPPPAVKKAPEHDYLVIDATPAKRGGS